MLFELINYLVMGLGGLYPTYNKGEVLREIKKVGIDIHLWVEVSRREKNKYIEDLI